MPAIDRIGPYRVFFFSNEAGERAHVHLKREKMVAKFWLDPVSLAWSRGFASAELRRLEKLVVDNAAKYRAAWEEYFSE